MMRFKVFIAALAVLILTLVTGFSVLAQNPLTTPACGLGSYWLVQGGGWHSVYIRQGQSEAFSGYGAFWQEDDVTSSLSIAINGDQVSASQVSDPNVWGTLTCQYQGTVRPDGVSVVGTSTCELTTGTSMALAWSAHIVCDTPLITWSDTAFFHRAAKGSQFSFQCPPNGFAAPIWGTGVYIEGSSICAAAVHAGVITIRDGGFVTIEITPGELSYPGSTSNGITSQTFPTPGQFDASFRVVGGQQPQNVPTATPTIVLGTGAVQLTLRWDNQADMDLSVTEPNGETISYISRSSSTGGQLDVDSNYPCGQNLFSVENIFWPNTGAPSGTYQVEVNQFSACSGNNANWTLEVRVNGQLVLSESGSGGRTTFSFNA